MPGVDLRSGARVERVLFEGTAAVAESAIAGASRLVDSRTPQSMGALFKAMVIAHADLPTPAPFAADVPAPDAAP